MQRPPARQRGLGQFEFALVVALIGVLAVALLERLLVVEAEAERLEVSLTIRHVRIGLQLAVGERIMRGQEDRLAELLAVNPVTLLGRQPQGYIGETGEPGGPGSWRYEPLGRLLAYRPRQPEAFGGQEELYWRIRAQGGAGGRVTGIRLEAES